MFSVDFGGSILSKLIDEGMSTELGTKMARILIGGAGGAPSEGVIYSLMKPELGHQIIGVGSDPSDLVLSKAHETHLVPQANHHEYKEKLLSIVSKVRPDMVHFQNDSEIFIASQFRQDLESLGARTFMPPHSVIDACVHKHKSYLAFSKAGIVVPKNRLLNSPPDLKAAFDELTSDSGGPLWLRSTDIGGGGKGSISTSNYELAKAWIDHYEGWGSFAAAEHLTNRTVTWTSIWYEGELKVAQTRRRQGWVHGNRSVSGVTGVTKVGVTDSDPMVDAVAVDAIHAVTDSPHGIFGVDMTYDSNDIPNPTEINISRFFTTIRFFTDAGLNLPSAYVELAMTGKYLNSGVKVNPLPNNLGWFRGMDTEPLLLGIDEFNTRFHEA